MYKVSYKSNYSEKYMTPFLNSLLTWKVQELFFSDGIPGASSDNDWLHGDFTPGKRCANFGDEGCANGKNHMF